MLRTVKANGIVIDDDKTICCFHFSIRTHSIKYPIEWLHCIAFMFYSVLFCWHVVMCIAYMQHCTLCDQWGFLSIACSHDDQDTTYASAQKQHTLIHTLENSIGVRRYIRVWWTKCSDKFSHLRVQLWQKQCLSSLLVRIWLRIPKKTHYAEQNISQEIFNDFMQKSLILSTKHCVSA